MKTEQTNYFDVHFFVCCNEREPGKASCGASGGKTIRDRLKEEIKKAQKVSGSTRKIRVNQAGCLGRCEEGVVCVSYPKGEWILNAKPTEEEIQNIIKKIDP